MEVSGDNNVFVSYDLKPQLRTLGPKYGALLGKIREVLQSRANEIVSAIKSCGLFRADVEGREVELSNDDLLISMKNKEGYSSESDGETTVVLDTQLTDDLIFEGAEREIVSKIQTMRKEAGFEVTDRIVLGYKAEGVSGRVLKEMADEIKSDVLAEEITNTPDGYVKDFDINGESVTLGVKKV